LIVRISGLGVVLTFALAAGGCASTARHADSDAVATRAAQNALAMRGKPYHYGGSSPAGFDCSGLVYYSYAQAGVRLPRSTEGLWDISRSVSRRDIRAGDLLFFTQSGKRSSHVALYLGSERFIHAPSSGKKVTVATMSDPYWVRHFEGARRPRLD
jgi:cell wall-associated NlpC family hydrolase